MAIGVLKNARLYVGALDLSGLANSLSLPVDLPALESTPINTTGPKSLTPAGIGFKLAFNGWQEYGVGLSDEVLAANVTGGQTDIPFSVWTSGTEGELAYLGKLGAASYAPGGKVQDLMAYSVDGTGTGPPVRGNSLAYGAKTANGNGTAFQLGAVTAGQSVYACLHVLAYTGLTSITVKIQSAAVVGFATPHDQITFTAATAVGSQFATLAGANVDTYWRALWTVAGTGSATIAVTMGIQ
jgi:hypothetical protein